VFDEVGPPAGDGFLKLVPPASSVDVVGFDGADRQPSHLVNLIACQTPD
jgi:hypothetical protein